MTMGTSQMLSCMEERIHDLNRDIEVTCFGQEFNPSTFAIAKADMMIRGVDPNNMRFGDTLSDDQFSGYTFQYCISIIRSRYYGIHNVHSEAPIPFSIVFQNAQYVPQRDREHCSLGKPKR